MLLMVQKLKFFYSNERKVGIRQYRDTCEKVGSGPGEHYARPENRFTPGSERQIPYDLTCKWNLINKKTSKQNIIRDIEIKKKLAVTRGERGDG